jgi:hypothetical protein
MHLKVHRDTSTAKHTIEMGERDPLTRSRLVMGAQICNKVASHAVVQLEAGTRESFPPSRETGEARSMSSDHRRARFDDLHARVKQGWCLSLLPIPDRFLH